MPAITKKIQAYISHAYPEFIVACCIFLFSFFTFQHKGIQLDQDSDSYMYLVQGMRLQNFMRPPLYPLILKAIWMIHATQAYTLLYIFQTACLTMAFLVLRKTALRIFRNQLIVDLITFFCVINLHVIQYTQYVNPEIVLILLITLLSYTVTRMHEGVRWIILSVSLITASIFTKPIFLYYRDWETVSIVTGKHRDWETSCSPLKFQ